MTTLIERIDAKMADARKQLEKATDKRDGAILILGKSAASIKQAQRALARLEKHRREARAAQQAERKAAAKRTAEDGPLPAL